MHEVRGQQWTVDDWCAEHCANGSMAASLQELTVCFCLRIIFVMFIVRSILVLDLWFSSFILYGSLTLYCKLRLLK